MTIHISIESLGTLLSQLYQIPADISPQKKMFLYHKSEIYSHVYSFQYSVKAIKLHHCILYKTLLWGHEMFRYSYTMLQFHKGDPANSCTEIVLRMEHFCLIVLAHHIDALNLLNFHEL